MPATADMKDHVYKILELVGSSEKDIDDAIQNAFNSRVKDRSRDEMSAMLGGLSLESAPGRAAE
jgi:Dodecin